MSQHYHCCNHRHIRTHTLNDWYVDICTFSSAFSQINGFLFDKFFNDRPFVTIIKIQVIEPFFFCTPMRTAHISFHLVNSVWTSSDWDHILFFKMDCKNYSKITEMCTLSSMDYLLLTFLTLSHVGPLETRCVWQICMCNQRATVIWVPIYTHTFWREFVEYAFALDGDMQCVFVEFSEVQRICSKHSRCTQI